MLVIWNERARPMRARLGAGSAVMSAPAKRTVPVSGSRLPASWLMKVVLPAPFGPITAWVSPSLTSKSMPSQARSAPKLFVSPLTSSIGFVEHAGETAPEKDHREDQQRPEDHLPVLGPALEQLLDQQQREGAEHRARGARHAAEDHHEHDVARLLPAHQAGRDIARMVGVQRARQPAHRAGEDEGRQAVRIRRKADRPRARLVRFGGAKHHAEPRIYNSVNQK